ncbi:MAG: topoisomerase C-terminal repeat-containing protein [Chthoniobacterales bacterium]
MENNFEDDLGAMVDEHLEAEERQSKTTSFRCPKSGLPVEVFESAFDFPGYPDSVFYKTIAQRTMSVPDYITILRSGEEGVKFEGFHSEKLKRDFSARVRFNPNKVSKDGELSPGVEFVFEKPRETGVLCPISNQPVLEKEKTFYFPGYPALTFWKTISGREMSAAEYREILTNGGMDYEGFRSRKTGKQFKATLKYVEKSERAGGKPSIDFDFN